MKTHLGYITAYKCWGLYKRNNQLKIGMLATTLQMFWKPHETAEAVCGHFDFSAKDIKRSSPCHTSPSPTKNCYCGFYALKQREDAEKENLTGVLGTVALWGKIIEHDKGYRAQYAYPLSFDEISSYWGDFKTFYHEDGRNVYVIKEKEKIVEIKKQYLEELRKVYL